MLRHSRAMARHHRERVIARRQKLFTVIWGWDKHKTTPGTLSKYSAHHHYCFMCSYDGEYNRAKEKQAYGKLSQKT